MIAVGRPASAVIDPSSQMAVRQREPTGRATRADTRLAQNAWERP